MFTCISNESNGITALMNRIFGCRCYYNWRKFKRQNETNTSLNKCLSIASFLRYIIHPLVCLLSVLRHVFSVRDRFEVESVRKTQRKHQFENKKLCLPKLDGKGQTTKYSSIWFIHWAEIRTATKTGNLKGNIPRQPISKQQSFAPKRKKFNRMK